MYGECTINMEKFSLRSIALKWYYFACIATAALFAEYFNLFMKQLGFNAGQTGLTTLLGIPQLFIPLSLMFAEKFRVRKIVAVIGVLGALICCVLPLQSLVVPTLKPACHTKTNVMASATATEVGNESVRYAFRPNKKNFGSHKSLQTRKYGFNDSNSLVSNRSAFKIPPIIHVNNSPQSVHSQHFGNGSVRLSKLQPRIRISGSQIHNPSAYLTSMTVSSSQKTDVQSKNSGIFKRLSKYEPLQSGFNNSILHLHFNTSASPSTHILNSLPLFSGLFLVLTISRSLTQFFQHINMCLANLAAMTFLQGDKENYGIYPMWSQIACAFFIPSVAILAWYIRINICGVINYGYFIAFIWGGVLLLLSMLSVPWFRFEYDEKKTFSWSGVKTKLFNVHYILMFVILFYTGMCMSFQVFWEFWYLDELSATPLLIGGAVVIRRPLLALSMFLSCHCIRKIGDLNTVCLALVLYACSFLALSFTCIAWLVIVIDTFQATAYGLHYCAFVCIFSKIASKENSSVIFGKWYF